MPAMMIGQQSQGMARGGPAARPPLSVGVILTDLFTLSAFSLFIDHLRLAADEGDRSRPIAIRWSVMHPRAEPVLASCGVRVSRTSGLLDLAELDYVVLVGGLLHGGRTLDEATLAYLRAAAKAGVPLVGLCTASFILCRAGLMRGRRVCVNWYHYQDFIAEFPEQEADADRLFVIDGDRITAAGGAGGAELAWHVGRQPGAGGAAQTANQGLGCQRRGAGHEAQPHPRVGDGGGDPRIRRALLLMEQNLADPLPIGAIALRLSLSTRQLERLFQAGLGQRPAMVYRTLRLRYARWLLDTTERSVTEIALDAGFSDCAHFSRQFKEAHGFTPSDKRGAVLATAGAQLAGSRIFE
jgi:transcriptional regulator GlxA family with amidase domain